MFRPVISKLTSNVSGTTPSMYLSLDHFSGRRELPTECTFQWSLIRENSIRTSTITPLSITPQNLIRVVVNPIPQIQLHHLQSQKALMIRQTYNGTFRRYNPHPGLWF
jgi:hypothetical protein